MAAISFARGAPAPECLDQALIADCARAALERDGTTILSYGTGGGYGPLREVLAAQHGVAANRVFVTTGGLQGFVFYAAAQLAQRPGRVLVEGPTYDRPLKILARDGAEVVPIAMDDEGLDLDALEAELKRGGDDLVPLHDPDVPESVRSHARDRSSATTRRTGGRSTTCRSSRTIRTVASATTASRFLRSTSSRAGSGSRSRPRSRRPWRPACGSATSSFRRDSSPRTTTAPSRPTSRPSLLPQATVFELIDRGAFGPNLDRVRGLLKVRKDAMLAALAAEMPAGTSWSSPRGRLLPLARLRGRRRCGCAADASDRSRGHLRARLGLLPERLCRPLVGAARVQLRDAGADRRRRRAARLAAVGASA